MRDEPRFTGAALFFLALIAPTLLAMAIDSRLFHGDTLWLKPLKFQLALLVYLATLAFYARFLPEGMTERRSYRAFSWVVVLCAVAEMIWIAGAASAAVASHYNRSNVIMAAIYPLMGLLATILTSAALVYGIAILRTTSARLAPPLQRALGLSLILTFVLTLITAGTLSAGPWHFIGVPVTGASLPLIGWSGEVGDLRVPHFFALHAMHLIPFAALILPASQALSGILATGYALLTAALFAQALAGMPLIAL